MACMGLFSCAIFSLGSRFVCWGDGAVPRMRHSKYLPLGLPKKTYFQSGAIDFSHIEIDAFGTRMRLSDIWSR